MKIGAIGTVPAGASIARCSRGFIIACPDRPPYILTLDGEEIEIKIDPALSTEVSFLADRGCPE